MIRIWLLLLTCSSLTGLAQVNNISAVLSQETSIDACGNQNSKQCILSVYLGPITKSDSLYGFDIGIAFNSKKIKFNSTLYSNTLSEFFETETRSFTFWDDTIRGYAGNFNISNPQVFGDKPLIAFLGDFVGDCPDTSFVKLLWLEFTEEFKKNISDTVNAVIEAKIFDKPSRLLKAQFSADSLEFDEQLTKDVYIKFLYGSEARLGNIEFNFNLEDNILFEISSLITESDKIEILDMIPINKGLKVKVNILDSLSGSEALRLTIKQKKNTDEISKILIDSVKVDECSCITRLGTDTILLKGYKKDSTSVEVKEKLNSIISSYYDSKTDEFIIKSVENKIKKVYLYDIRGILIESVGNELLDGYIKIQANKLCEGVYLALTRNELNEINRIVLIKNE
jgi:hypothetical protein